ncbi:MAG: hypothetical protein EOM21_15915 [Gammaproteobacteria bacterium]|nr:hypothetical protein [Gammaproteobacteria bacterium]
MNAFQNLTTNLPVGSTVSAHWAKQDPVILDAAALVLEAHGANPWVFSGDERMFRQFARPEDQHAFDALSVEQSAALCYWLETIAEQLADESYDSDGGYCRPSERQLIEAGGTRVASSNWDENCQVVTAGYSFSPTEVWFFPDGSTLEVGYSGCWDS